MIELARARAIAEGFRRQRIVVLGDVMLDRYVQGTVDRISPEAPVPVVLVKQVSRMPGGAANVAANVKALGGEAVLVGVVGGDAAAAELVATLRERGLRTDGLLDVPDLPTTVKMRILAERQQVVRVDWERPHALPPELRSAFCDRIRRHLQTATGAVIEDYAKGIVAQEEVDTVLTEARRRNIPVALDPKDNLSLRIAGLALATPNCREAHVCAGLPPRTAVEGDPLQDAQLRRAAETLLERWQPGLLIVTLGAQGMYLVSRATPPRVIPTRAREVFDVTGAGDTVIATCLLALAAGASGEEAAVLGNHAAGVVVGKLGPATCTPDELLASVARDGGGAA